MEQLKLKLSSLVVFRNLLNDKVIEKFMNIDTDNVKRGISTYSDFVAALFEENTNFSEYIRDLVLNDENCYTKSVISGSASHIQSAVMRELKILSELAGITSEYIINEIDNEFPMQGFLTSDINLIEAFEERMKKIGKIGYGMFAKYHMFIVENNELLPVKTPDSVTLEILGGYEYERKLVIDNTKALICGKPASNILLYGHSGTGKSSTVKAVANEFKNEGLRLIEVKKDSIKSIPRLMDKLSGSPLKFIIFIDDLSFNKNDDTFSAMKAILEGSVASTSANVVIYATSNRRHMVKETFGDRQGDEIHITDSIEEMSSLSERFGLKIVFSKPDKMQYLEIVRNLAKIYGLDIDDETLINAAERHALAKGGRSARGARQVVECLSCGIYDF